LSLVYWPKQTYFMVLSSIFSTGWVRMEQTDSRALRRFVHVVTTLRVPRPR
jgi:hypothetical protein